MGAWVTILTMQVSKGAAKSTLMGPGVDFSGFLLDFEHLLGSILGLCFRYLGDWQCPDGRSAERSAFWLIGGGNMAGMGRLYVLKT